MSVTYLSDYLKKQAHLSESLNSQSLANTKSEKLGTTRTDFNWDDDLSHLIRFWTVLDKASREPFTVKSDFARAEAWYIAVCASQGLLTTEIDHELFGNKWMLTEGGDIFMENCDERIKELL